MYHCAMFLFSIYHVQYFYIFLVTCIFYVYVDICTYYDNVK